MQIPVVRREGAGVMIGMIGKATYHPVEYKIQTEKYLVHSEISFMIARYGNRVPDFEEEEKSLETHTSDNYLNHLLHALKPQDTSNSQRKGSRKLRGRSTSFKSV
jgi:hypothetical protein